MNKLLVVLCIFCRIQMNVFSQSLYSAAIKKDVTMGILSLGVGISPFFISNKPEDIPRILNRNGVNAFDRSLMFSHNRPLDIISDYTPFGLALLPVISIMPNIKHPNALLTYSIMYGESLLLTYGTVFSLKNAIIRYRPYMYAGGVPPGKENDYYNSFPSSAASFAFLSATFLSTTFSHEFPESKWKFPIITGSYALAAGIGLMRILTGTHFLTDVFAGAAIGSLYGWLIPWLHIRKDNGNIKIIPAGNGMIVSLKF
jgi:membrane-associated phospholipid phosphatase